VSRLYFSAVRLDYCNALAHTEDSGEYTGAVDKYDCTEDEVELSEGQKNSGSQRPNEVAEVVH